MWPDGRVHRGLGRGEFDFDGRHARPDARRGPGHHRTARQRGRGPRRERRAVPRRRSATPGFRAVGATCRTARWSGWITDSQLLPVPRRCSRQVRVGGGCHAPRGPLGNGGLTEFPRAPSTPGAEHSIADHRAARPRRRGGEVICPAPSIATSRRLAAEGVAPSRTSPKPTADRGECSAVEPGSTPCWAASARRWSPTTAPGDTTSRHLVALPRSRRRFGMGSIGLERCRRPPPQVPPHAGDDESALTIIEKLIREAPPGGCRFTAEALLHRAPLDSRQYRPPDPDAIGRRRGAAAPVLLDGRAAAREQRAADRRVQHLRTGGAPPSTSRKCACSTTWPPTSVLRSTSSAVTSSARPAQDASPSWSRTFARCSGSPSAAGRRLEFVSPARRRLCWPLESPFIIILVSLLHTPIPTILTAHGGEPRGAAVPPAPPTRPTASCRPDTARCAGSARARSRCMARTAGCSTCSPAPRSDVTDQRAARGSSVRPRRWKRSAASPAASPTTSTICSRPSSGYSELLRALDCRRQRPAAGDAGEAIRRPANAAAA